MKVKHSEIAGLRKVFQEQQDNQCAVCGCDFSEAYYNHKKKKAVAKHTPCLDHSHKHGQIRDVLCSGCNSLEGKIINCIERWHTSVDVNSHLDIAYLLERMADYYIRHNVDVHGMDHPSFKTSEEKRLLKNKRARLKRKQTK